MLRPVKFGLMYPVGARNAATLDRAAEQLRKASPPGQVETADFWLTTKLSTTNAEQLGFSILPALSNQPVPPDTQRLVVVISNEDVPLYKAIKPLLEDWRTKAERHREQGLARPMLPPATIPFVRKAADVIANALEQLRIANAETVLKLLSRSRFDVETGQPIGAQTLNSLSLQPEGHTLQ